MTAWAWHFYTSKTKSCTSFSTFPWQVFNELPLHFVKYLQQHALKYFNSLATACSHLIGISE